MALNPGRAVEQARILHDYHLAERPKLDTIRQYWKGRQARPAVIPTSAPHEVRVMARSARVNVMPIVINSLVQSMYVDGFRAKDDSDDLQVWDAWQRNRMDARQTGVHRAMSGFGTSYAVVLPGDTAPVIRGVSPRNMTCLYGEDPDWPIWAFERLGGGLWRLYDDEASYYVSEAGKRYTARGTEQGFEHVETREHPMEVTPVVRFLDEDDLDADDEVEYAEGMGDVEDLPTRGQVSPLMPLQDQLDLTTLGLQIAQHWGAFRQRYILGWVADSEKQLMEASAAHIMTFADSPEEIKVGEFEQTDLKGYLESREATLRHAASFSQTPVHELIGELVNLSAEALAAAEAGRDRKIEERQALAGESHEQMFWLVGKLMDIDIPDDSQVVWRDTSARAFAATVDALGKLSQMLGVPPQELWERIPGTTKQDIDRWRAAAQSGDSFAFLTDLLERQGDGNPALNGAGT